MKKLLFYLFMLIPLASNAEDNVNYKLFKNAVVVNLTEDFSNFRIIKMPPQNYLEMKYNMDYQKFTKNFMEILLSTANTSFNEYPLKISNDQPSDFELKIMPVSADGDGEHTIMCRLVYKPTDTLISSFKLNTNGGDNGAFIEELMKRLSISGKKLAKKLESIKKIANSTK